MPYVQREANPGGVGPGVNRTVRLTLRDVAAEEIRSRVFSADLRPGTRIDQEALARDLGVSRVPVREALITLNDEGIVESVARRGVFVAALSRADVHDHYLLGLVSGVAAERAAQNLGPENVAGLRQLVQRMASAVTPAEEEQLNFELHRRINRAAGSRRLLALLRILVKAIPNTFYESHSQWPEKARDDHARIIHALAQGDGRVAGPEMEQHFTDAADRADAHLEGRGFWAAPALPLAP
jgi:DNA-binding GntR family transcriptional regulator